MWTLLMNAKLLEEQDTCSFLCSQPGAEVILKLLCDCDKLNFIMEVNPVQSERKDAKKEILIAVPK